MDLYQLRYDQEMTVNKSTLIGCPRGWKLLGMLVLIVTASGMAGCEVDSFFDPSRTGRFEFTPTTIPILDRIDVIEKDEELWGQTTGVRPEDLLPSDLTYFMAAGDVVTVEIFELHVENEWSISTRRIDVGGYYRVPELGDISAAGLTAQEFEDELRERLSREIIIDPQVNAVVEEFSGFTYTTYGLVLQPGVYKLQNPDLRLLDALASSGGVPATGVDVTIYVIREVALTDEVRPAWEGGPGRRPAPKPDEKAPVDIDDLLDQLDRKDGDPSPGAFSQDQSPPVVDIEELEPTIRRSGDVEFGYDPDRDEWDDEELILERIIEIPYERLRRGDSSYNIIIRPSDRIFAEGPAVGVVYIDGEVTRPGVYNLPTSGKLTLSRLIAAAGGLSQLAIPERVDLTRVVDDNREATIRLNLAAIRQRTEPDLMLKSDDHIIIGTNWLATPLAVFRSGLRVTYGFGFLLDRNFGNDVFGAPPVNFRN